MKLLVLGKGFLGTQFEKAGHTVLDRSDWEWTQPGNSSMEELLPFLLKSDVVQYDAVVNCIAESNTRWCEDRRNWEDVWSTNVELPRHLSELCADEDIKYVHISTGCLYDRNDTPQTEEDFIAAHCQYSVSKWVAEAFIDPDRDLILRPRLLLGDESHPNNLISKLQSFDRFLLEPNSYTHIQTIVEATVALLEANQSGIFNVCEDDGEKAISPWEIAAILGLDGDPMPLTSGELRQDHGIYLVNNTMSVEKLKEFYEPMSILDRLEDLKEQPVITSEV